MESSEIFGSNQPEDVSWLLSLSESELDMLIGVKELVIHRAKLISCNALADKFNLKMLRALGFILMEYLKQRVKELSDIPSLSNASKCLDGCNLLNQNLKNDNTISIEDLRTLIGTYRKKRTAERQHEEADPDQKKVKTEDSCDDFIPSNLTDTQDWSPHRQL